MRKLASLIVTVVSLSGCTEMFRAVSSDPVRVELINHHLRDDKEPAAATVSLTAERRTVIVSTRGDSAGRFCAEPPPDVASDLLSALGASIKTKGAEGALNSVYSESAVKLADRSTALDIYRTGTYVLRQYHLNGGIDGGQLNKNFELLTTQVITALVESYKQPRQVVVDGTRLFTVVPGLDLRTTSGTGSSLTSPPISPTPTTAPAGANTGGTPTQPAPTSQQQR